MSSNPSDQTDRPEVFANKSPALINILTELAPSGKDPREGFCAICGSEVDPSMDFRDKLSRKEWTISGMCQTCQDKFFGFES